MKTIIFILAFLIQSVNLFSQSDSQITAINKKVFEIKKNIGIYKAEVKNWKDSSNNVRIIYRLKKTVKNCTSWYVDNYKLKKAEWYFSDGFLIYVENTWTEENLQVTLNEKYYLENGHIIKGIEDRKIMDKNSDYFKFLDKQLSDASKTWAKDAK